MRLLVTGGAGYVGSHTCVVLLQAGHELVILDDFSNSSAEIIRTIRDLAGGTLKSIEADIRDRAAVRAAFALGPYDAILHFAALKSAPESMIEPVRYWDVNVGGMAILLDEALASGVGKVHFLDGKQPHALLLELFTDAGIGTQIAPTK